MKKFGIGIYKKEDYQEILNISSDRETMNATWKEWKKNKEKAVRNLLASGVRPIEIPVTPRELVDFCRQKGLEINGHSRANFISYKTSLLD